MNHVSNIKKLDFYVITLMNQVQTADIIYIKFNITQKAVYGLIHGTLQRLFNIPLYICTCNIANSVYIIFKQ